MRPMSLRVCGMVASVVAATALAQQRPEQGWNWRPEQPATLKAWQQTETRNQGFTPPAPRGDLRGDIASNVRARPDGQRDEAAQRRAPDAR